jgi:hypothetical protein
VRIGGRWENGALDMQIHREEHPRRTLLRRLLIPVLIVVLVRNSPDVANALLYYLGTVFRTSRSLLFLVLSLFYKIPIDIIVDSFVV